MFILMRRNSDTGEWYWCDQNRDVHVLVAQLNEVIKTSETPFVDYIIVKNYELNMSICLGPQKKGS